MSTLSNLNLKTEPKYSRYFFLSLSIFEMCVFELRGKNSEDRALSQSSRRENWSMLGVNEMGIWRGFIYGYSCCNEGTWGEMEDLGRGSVRSEILI